MRANEDMMPKLSICHGHGSKMNFSVSDYIRGDTAYLTLHHLCCLVDQFYCIVKLPLECFLFPFLVYVIFLICTFPKAPKFT